MLKAGEPIGVRLSSMHLSKGSTLALFVVFSNVEFQKEPVAPLGSTGDKTVFKVIRPDNFKFKRIKFQGHNYVLAHSMILGTDCAELDLIVKFTCLSSNIKNGSKHDRRYWKLKCVYKNKYDREWNEFGEVSIHVVKEIAGLSRSPRRVNLKIERPIRFESDTHIVEEIGSLKKRLDEIADIVGEIKSGITEIKQGMDTLTNGRSGLDADDIGEGVMGTSGCTDYQKVMETSDSVKVEVVHDDLIDVEIEDFYQIAEGEWRGNQ